MHDEETELCTEAERTFLRLMDGSCQVPIAGHATMVGESIEFTGLIMSPDGKEKHKVTHSGGNPIEIGTQVAKAMEQNGAKAIIETLNQDI